MLDEPFKDAATGGPDVGDTDDAWAEYDGSTRDAASFGGSSGNGNPTFGAPPHDGDAGFVPPNAIEGIVPLGHDRGIYYYLSRATGQVEAVPAAGHSRAMLAHLASEAHYWEHTRFKTKKGVNWDSAADDLRVRCRAVGIYDPERVRGRGAWIDGERSVLHLGDRLIVDGQETGLTIPGSRHVYEHSQRINAPMALPAAPLTARRLMELCVALPWENPESAGRLLAGWLVIAPVCGAMPWRPHLWITSEATGGKSWVLDNVVKPLVPLSLDVQSKTTEAGIRQLLGCDARPVIFDEAESQNEQDRARIQLVLDLARQASNEVGAAIVKGSASGRAMRYRIRSCFAFSSINLGMSQAADESRIVALTLKLELDEKARAAAFKKLQKLHADIMVPGFADALLARTLLLLPAIRKNAVIFAEAIARSGQSRRTGDTYGVILAGAWSLRSPRVASPEEADEFITKVEWAKQAVSKAKVEPEYQRALTHLLQHRERVANSNGLTQDIPIGEMIDAVLGSYQIVGLLPRDADTCLRRIGLRVAEVCQEGSTDVVEKVLYVANRSGVIDNLFSRTPWAIGWLSTLSRAPGAKKDAANLRLPTQTKCLSLPICLVSEQTDCAPETSGNNAVTGN